MISLVNSMITCATFRWYFQATGGLECGRKDGQEGVLHRDAPHKEGVTRLRNSTGSSSEPCSRPRCRCLRTTRDGHFCEQFRTSCGAGTDGHLRNIADAWARRRLRTRRISYVMFFTVRLVFLFISPSRVYFFDVPVMTCSPEFHTHIMFPNEFKHSLISIILYLFSGPAVGGFNSISMPAPPHTYSPQAKYAYCTVPTLWIKILTNILLC